MFLIQFIQSILIILALSIRRDIRRGFDLIQLQFSAMSTLVLSISCLNHAALHKLVTITLGSTLQPRQLAIRAAKLLAYVPGDPVADSHVRHHRIDTAGTRENTRIADIQPLSSPDFAFGIHNAVALAYGHAVCAHLMRGRESCTWGLVVGIPELLKPDLKARVGDAGVYLLGRDRGGGSVVCVADEGGDNWDTGVDLDSTFDVRDLGEGDTAGQDVLAVKRARCIFDADATSGRVGVNAAGIAIPGKRDPAVSVAEFEGQLLEVEAHSDV